MEGPTTAPDTKNPDFMKKTPAGAQINCDWDQVRPALQGFALFLAGVFGSQRPASDAGWHVMFRCGTVLHVAPGDTEFQGYTAKNWAFPEGGTQDAATVELISRDNARVWEAQRALPGPPGKAIRQAYARLLGPGYPHAGDRQSNRSGVTTGVALDPLGELFLVHWPNMEKARALSLSFSNKGLADAVALAGDRRRHDYMFPEVAAVISPRLEIWSYGADGTFSDAHLV